MNYLAHAFLSGQNRELLIGNFIADHLRGNNFKEYSPALIEGIHMHRRIDTFTDAHPLFKASKRLFYEGFEKFSGVLVDIYFDHMLAHNFEQYSSLSLKDFAEQTYAVYRSAETLLPPHSQRFLNYVLRNDIYTGYADLAVVEKVLGHLSQRVGLPGLHLDQSVALFKKHEAQLQLHFNGFFREAISQFLPGWQKPA